MNQFVVYVIMQLHGFLVSVFHKLGIKLLQLLFAARAKQQTSANCNCRGINPDAMTIASPYITSA